MPTTKGATSRPEPFPGGFSFCAEPGTAEHSRRLRSVPLVTTWSTLRISKKFFSQASTKRGTGLGSGHFAWDAQRFFAARQSGEMAHLTENVSATKHYTLLMRQMRGAETRRCSMTTVAERTQSREMRRA